METEQTLMDGATPLRDADLRSRPRLAIISTPRSGNTWLRFLISGVYGLTGLGDEQVAVHHPDDIDWAHLPERCVLQLHWPRTESFARQLETHGFQAVVIARHPLDVLLSILQFAPRDGKTARWLEGSGGDESSLSGALPTSESFLSYACGPRASALLGVSREWWDAPGVRRVRYEDLVKATAPRLRALLDGLAPYPPGTLLAAVEANAIQNLRAEHASQIHHFWQGKPGLWRHLIPPDVARAVRQAQADVFEATGYEVEPDESLGPDVADARWFRMELDFARSQLDSARVRQAGTAAEAEGLRRELASVRQELAAVRDLQRVSQAQLDAAREGWHADRQAAALASEAMDAERRSWLGARDDLWNRLTFALERLAEVERLRDASEADARTLRSDLDGVRSELAGWQEHEAAWGLERGTLRAQVVAATRQAEAAAASLLKARELAESWERRVAATQVELRPYRLLDPLGLLNRWHAVAATCKQSLARGRWRTPSTAEPIRGPIRGIPSQQSAPSSE